ncbi:Pathogen-associated molecular patterns-induced protein A70 [Cardamine amara subsp. amara]|uniref:Pathogen-associated molecular patterns-induced protein A70 n=1 Tax=Cardamine amara subsp. amara TaxID=228776 RepID=A0ABD1BJS0_CARAN
MELLSTAASWFTPTTLFLLLNLMIGTIVITSRFGSGSRKHHQQHHDGFGSGHAPAPLARAPSIIDRVKSINFHLYKFPHPETEIFSMTTHHDVIGSDLHVYPDPNPAPLQRAPSLLDRVKSINMSYFKFPHDVTGSDPHSHFHSDSNPYPAPLQRAPSLLDRVKSINMSYFKFQQYNPEENDYANHTERTGFENIPTRMGRVDPIDISKFKIPEENKPTGPGFNNPIDTPGLTRAPSILERVKSIKLSSFYRSDPELDQNPDPNSILHEDHKPTRSKSESKKPVKKKNKATGKMTKSASDKSGFGFIGSHEEAETVESVERRRPDTTRVERTTSFGDGEDCVDAKASDFINKFKQQLKLQRLDSILRYKEMPKAN